jgi:5-(carboxyamino)imidazole ribonucleotide mutase
MAAHLAGVIAGHSILPVIGVPMKGGAMDGLDALLATVQMPGGIPVATLALGNAGATNAGILAAQILALNDATLRQKLHDYKRAMEEKVNAADARLQDEL